MNYQAAERAGITKARKLAKQWNGFAFVYIVKEEYGTGYEPEIYSEREYYGNRTGFTQDARFAVSPSGEIEH